MQTLKKTAVTLVGGVLLLIGVIFIIVPGPAVVFIPLGLALLALEYPVARTWLKKFQRIMSNWAYKADRWLAKRKR